MKINLKNIAVVSILFVFAAIILTGCGKTEDKIVGNWQETGEYGEIMEIYDGGTAIMRGNPSDPGETYTWVLSNDTITFTPEVNLFNNPEVYEVSFEKDSMILTEGDNSRYFERQ
ncbi:MAG: hypothetical protein PHC41_10180 [Lachnospiraceae bacterium]|jgi:hypothetical protein|nr:hypothetical protein [Lachnospiraceae bacterium]MDD3616578.1 hypothetical protein [Lachnospiraceae bacterium]